MAALLRCYYVATGAVVVWRKTGKPDRALDLLKMVRQELSRRDGFHQLTTGLSLFPWYEATLLAKMKRRSDSVLPLDTWGGYEGHIHAKLRPNRIYTDYFTMDATRDNIHLVHQFHKPMPQRLHIHATDLVLCQCAVNAIIPCDTRRLVNYQTRGVQSWMHHRMTEAWYIGCYTQKYYLLSSTKTIVIDHQEEPRERIILSVHNVWNTPPNRLVLRNIVEPVDIDIKRLLHGTRLVLENCRDAVFHSFDDVSVRVPSMVPCVYIVDKQQPSRCFRATHFTPEDRRYLTDARCRLH